MSEERLRVLIATIGDRITGLEEILRPPREEIRYVVSHQVDGPLGEDASRYVESLRGREDVVYSRLEGRGVAKNRNNTLHHVKVGEICLVLDDDVRLCENAFENVRKAFEENPKADFVSFKILKTEDGSDYKEYSNRKMWHTLSSLTGIGTTEMAFRSAPLLESGVVFDERFGPGSERYPVGEDFIFAVDLYRRGLKMLFLPVPIVEHPSVGTGDSLDPAIVFGRGAVFARLFGPLSYLLDFYYAVRKREFYRSAYGFSDYLKTMLSGSRDFLKSPKESA